MNERLAEQLTERLSRALPGPMIDSRFEARPPSALRGDARPPDARAAAVLVLLYPHAGRWHLPLTLRPRHLADHGGQVCLPGGTIEPGESSRQAALREFGEELGGSGTDIELLGRLSSVYVEASSFLIEPWVAVAADRPDLVPNPAEVEALFEVPLADLLDEANFGSHQRQHMDRSCTAPHFLVQSHRVWGATCMILGELVTLLEGLEL